MRQNECKLTDDDCDKGLQHWNQLRELLIERQNAEIDAMKSLESAQQEVDWTRALLQKVESMREAGAAEMAAARANVASLQQQYAACSALLAQSEAREEQSEERIASVEAVIESLHQWEVADTRRCLESDAERVWGPGWRDR